MRLIPTLSICLLIFTGVLSQSETDPDIFDFEPTVTTQASEPEFSFDSEINEGSDVFEVSTAVVGLFSEPMEIDSPSKALAAAAAAANDQKSTESSVISENDGENEENIPDPFGNYDVAIEDDSKPSSASSLATSPTLPISPETLETTESSTLASTGRPVSTESPTSPISPSLPILPILSTTSEHLPEIFATTEGEDATTSLPASTESSVVSVTDQVLETRVLKEKEEAVTSSFIPAVVSSDDDVTTILPPTSSSESSIEVIEEKEPEILPSPTHITEEPVSSSLSPPTSTEDSDSEGEPFDSEGLSGLFEPDGSPTQVTKEETPAFPIVQLPEENEKILEHNPISISPSSFSPTASTETLEVKTSASSENDFSTTPNAIVEEKTTSEDVLSSSTIMPIEIETVASTDESSIEVITEASSISTEQPIVISSESSTIDVTTQTMVVSSTIEKTESTPDFSSSTTTVSSSEIPISTSLTPETTSQTKISQIPNLANRPTIPASYKAALVLRLTDLDYVLEFDDEKSGKYNKLKEQITPEVTKVLKEIIGHNFVSYDIQSFTKGSVVVHGDIVTRNEIANAEEIASKIESHISHNSQLLGKHTVDPRSITVNGIASRNFIEHIQSSYETSAPSVFLIGSVITIAVIVVLVVGILIIFLYNRRSNGGMKLKEDELSRTEKGSNATYDNPTTPVNLKSYNNPDHKSTTPSMVSDNSDHTVPIHF